MMSSSGKPGAPPIAATYTARVFEVRNVEEARRIILTSEPGATSESRWQLETPYLIDIIAEHFALSEEHAVLDYGCGLGRMAKALIERFGCRIIGVDTSTRMRELAPGYVQSARFSIVSPQILELLIARGVRFDIALAVWVIQHVAQVEPEIDCLSRALANQGGLFVANTLRRVVPPDKGWADDGIDVGALLTRKFEPVWKGRLPRDIFGDAIANATYLAVYRRP
jgi:SAM-dependent methyltransferase